MRRFRCPLPGVKPGLANIVTLIVLARYGWATAVWVSGLRVLAGSLLLGHFLAPGFFLTLTGTALSLRGARPRPSSAGALVRPGQPAASSPPSPTSAGSCCSPACG